LNSLEKGEGTEHTLLRQQKPKALLQRDALARPLVVGREAGRVRGLRHGAAEDFLQRVDAPRVIP